MSVSDNQPQTRLCERCREVKDSVQYDRATRTHLCSPCWCKTPPAEPSDRRQRP